MDNLTHTLFGLTLARTPLGRAGRGATAALVLGSNAPDVDIVTAVGGAVSYLEWHRGPTHGPLGIVGLGIASAGLIAIGSRLFSRDDEHPRASFRALTMVAMIGVLFHVLMDLPTSYGTRILSPFDSHWYALDWMPIIDILLLVILGAGLALPQRGTAVVLVLMLALYGLRAGARHRALSLAPEALGATETERCDEGSPHNAALAAWPRDDLQSARRASPARCLIEIAAIPRIWPLTWRLVGHFSDGYQVAEVHLSDTRFISRPQPNEWTSLIEKASQARAARVFLGFSRFPAAQLFTEKTGTALVQWTDVRFVNVPPSHLPPVAPAGTFFMATVRFDRFGDVIEARLGGR